MKNARRALRMTLRELSKKTNINIGRLSDLEHLRAVPTEREKKILSNQFGCAILLETDEAKAKERQDEIEQTLNATCAAIVEINQKHGKTNAQGVIECPLCKGKLHYTVAACNGHIWGKCETENCLSWMQ